MRIRFLDFTMQASAITADPTPDLTVVPEEGAPLTVERDGTRRTDRFHRFRVALDRTKSNTDASHFLTIVPYPDAAPPETAKVPVKVER